MFVKAEQAHVPYLAQHMRAIDVFECYHSTGLEPEDALQQSFDVSVEAWTFIDNSTPVCMFGIVQESNNIGIPWLLGTADIYKFKRRLLHDAKIYIQEMFKYCHILQNIVATQNSISIRWLEFLGFTVLRDKTISMQGAEFYVFFMNKGGCYV